MSLTSKSLAARFPLGAKIQLDELSRDPYPVFAGLRESEPVSFVAALNMYFVTRYDDVRDVLNDTEHFVVGTEKSLVYDMFGEHMMTVEGELHEFYKSAHQRFFLPPAVRANLEPRIRSHVDRLIDGFAAQQEVELRQAFASRLPVLTMLSLFGLDVGDEAKLREWYEVFEAALSNFTWEPGPRARGHGAAAGFHELIQGYLDRLSEAGVANRSGTLLDALVSAPDGERLTDEQIRHNALIIFFGGISTVEALILNALFALSWHPDALQRVREDAGLLPKVLNETIRWLGPVQSATRHVARDTELGGVRLHAGDTVNCMLAAANHDPDVFPAPATFDIDRSNAQRHVGFAVGPHHCLGSHLARAEARIALEALLTRLPDFRLDLDRTSPPSGYEFRQPKRATAVWSAP